MSAGSLDPAMIAMESAVTLIGEAHFGAAADALARAASLHRAAGRDYDEARCLQLAATLQRADGNRGDSRATLLRGVAVGSGDQALALSIRAEAAEQARDAGANEDALAGWTACIELGDTIGLADDARIALLDRRSEVLIELDRFDEAEVDLARACAIADQSTALRLRAEAADRLIVAGANARVAALLPSPDAAPDAGSRAALLITHARLAAAERRWDNAARNAAAARVAAREAIDAVGYFAASVELAKALDGRDDRAGAYGTLAATWATLGDLLGRETARSWVEPCLLGLKLRWGETAFAAARAAYEAERRRILAGAA